ncbi:hypothetical protein B0H16DRAFT_1702504 [Mycena metata]|uniref:Uncharacterized protein n=1 Tax=Mycena metata TaxID=1033252 RepID=A0AAD7H634_9AGAR|nr:hypothetical protein B0H16DRAFT_1702504 [Mycena metata]
MISSPRAPLRSSSSLSPRAAPRRLHCFAFRYVYAAFARRRNETTLTSVCRRCMCSPSRETAPLSLPVLAIDPISVSHHCPRLPPRDIVRSTALSGTRPHAPWIVPPSIKSQTTCGFCGCGCFSRLGNRGVNWIGTKLEEILRCNLKPAGALEVVTGLPKRKRHNTPAEQLNENVKCRKIQQGPRIGTIVGESLSSGSPGTSSTREQLSDAQDVRFPGTRGILIEPCTGQKQLRRKRWQMGSGVGLFHRRIQPLNSIGKNIEPRHQERREFTINIATGALAPILAGGR